MLSAIGRTDITIVLDRSGSMSAIHDDVVGGFNTFLDDQKHAPGEATFTLVQFDDAYEVLYHAVSIASVRPLTHQSFVPRGTTALLDAVGRTIDATGHRLSALPASHRPAKVIVVIITDGQENASKTFSRQQVFDKIAHQRDVYQWEFVFLAANQDAFVAASQIGIPYAGTMSYAASPQGVAETYRSLSRGVTNVRSGAANFVTFDDQDRAKAMDEGTTITTTDTTESDT